LQLLLEAACRISGTDQDRGCGMIPKSGYRFSDKIMREEQGKAAAPQSA